MWHVKRLAPAAERNKVPILEVLLELFPRSEHARLVLEFASGTGQHAAFFAAALPWLRWQPTDVDPEAIMSIAEYRFEAGLPNLEPPFLLDATSDDWSLKQIDGIVCINMIHIAPWTACLGLLAGAGRSLALGAPLILYGPFRIDGDLTAPSNEDFDRSLRQRDERWGVRELRDVERAALAAGLVLDRVVPRPANNHVVVFRNQRGADAS